MDLAVRDAEAYRRWSELHKARPENDPELLSATKEILQIPEALATLSLELLRECVRLAPKQTLVWDQILESQASWPQQVSRPQRGTPRPTCTWCHPKIEPGYKSS